MSYILDALKKAEHEREIGRVPGIGSEHEQALVAGSRPWMWLLLGVLLINAVLLVFALWPKSPQLRQVSVPPPSGPAASVPVAPAKLAGSPVSAGPVLHEPRQPLQRVPPAGTTVSRPAPETLRPLPPVAAADRPSEEEDAAADASATPMEVLPQASVAPAPASSDNNLPVWPEISAQLLGEINSSLHLDVHVYSETLRERFVLINMRNYHEGERLQEGPVVDAITPDGVILSFRGQRFRMQAK
ncbi:MAG: general secretion pathway protein GspB [Thiogranum sp.]|jgi:general secretion pathway protein B|nr:general secretion pathway protein GspB [Thiogranum sp.]